MRELAILTFITLDGVMQAPKDASEDPSNGFSSAGWANPWWDDVMTQVQAEAMAESYPPTPNLAAKVDRNRLWIITEADRASTTVLWFDEY